jgi:hypothetical protein
MKITLEILKAVSQRMINEDNQVIWADKDDQIEYNSMKRGFEALIQYFDSPELDSKGISIEWGKDDVRYAEELYKPTANLSPLEIDAVLTHVEYNHNAEIGINWDTIGISIDAIVNRRV